MVLNHTSNAPFAEAPTIALFAHCVDDELATKVIVPFPEVVVPEVVVEVVVPLVVVPDVVILLDVDPEVVPEELDPLVVPEVVVVEDVDPLVVPEVVEVEPLVVPEVVVDGVDPVVEPPVVVVVATGVGAGSSFFLQATKKIPDPKSPNDTMEIIDLRIVINIIVW